MPQWANRRKTIDLPKTALRGSAVRGKHGGDLSARALDPKERHPRSITSEHGHGLKRNLNSLSTLSKRVKRGP
jgi:hypothetical protein